MNGASARSAAFLEEMGIGPLWMQRGPAQALEAPAQEAPTLAEAPSLAEAVPLAEAAPPGEAVALAEAAPEAGPARELAAPAPPIDEQSAWGDDGPAAPPTDEQIAQMDWAQLRAAITACTRCGVCKGGRKPVHGGGAQQARWLVAAGASTAADEKERVALAGDPGRLLDNMLAAAGLARASNAYVTNLIKCRPTSASGADRAPTQDEALACRPYLERELALCGAKVVLTLGQIAANALQDKPLQEPLAVSRGTVHQLRGAALVATLHPGELLRRGADKALAWADLCLAKSADAGPG